MAEAVPAALRVVVRCGGGKRHGRARGSRRIAVKVVSAPVRSVIRSATLVSAWPKSQTTIRFPREGACDMRAWTVPDGLQCRTCVCDLGVHAADRAALVRRPIRNDRRQLRAQVRGRQGVADTGRSHPVSVLRDEAEIGNLPEPALQILGTPAAVYVHPISRIRGEALERALHFRIDFQKLFHGLKVCQRPLVVEHEEALGASLIERFDVSKLKVYCSVALPGGLGRAFQLPHQPVRPCAAGVRRGVLQQLVVEDLLCGGRHGDGVVYGPRHLFRVVRVHDDGALQARRTAGELAVHEDALLPILLAQDEFHRPEVDPFSQARDERHVGNRVQGNELRLIQRPPNVSHGAVVGAAKLSVQGAHELIQLLVQVTVHQGRRRVQDEVQRGVLPMLREHLQQRLERHELLGNPAALVQLVDADDDFSSDLPRKEIPSQRILVCPAFQLGLQVPKPSLDLFRRRIEVVGVDAEGTDAQADEAPFVGEAAGRRLQAQHVRARG
eukprot:scaffold149_cov315-Pinguiococcus_pyrenoidosus.AAC.121